ncbi:MAG: M48 family metalloprotease [Syntrophothermus sp.]|nr:M48 family metalloprotease [Ignavibacteriaceae bacterium]
MKTIKYLILSVFIAASSVFYSCDSNINIFSKADDVKLGQQVDAEMRANPSEYPIYHGDPSVKSYITTKIFNEILASPKIENKNVFNYQMELLDKPDELNAFAVPGGYLYVYTGLLKYLDSEAALAGVIGHEIAHAERRHATQRMTEYYGVSVLLGFVLGENPSQIEEIAANLLVGLAFLKNSRSDEDEADEYSFKYLQDTRFYPGGVKFFFEKMRDEGLISSNSSSIETFLSTHPDPIARISSTNQRLQSAGITVKDWKSSGTDIFRDEYLTNIRNKIN